MTVSFLWQRGPARWFLVHESELKLWPGWENEHANEEDIADFELEELRERIQWRIDRTREDLEAGEPALFDLDELDQALQDIQREQDERLSNQPE